MGTFRNFCQVTTPPTQNSQDKMAGLQPGMDAPTFKAAAVVKNELGEIDLKDFRGKYVVLLFYPADFTFVCPTEILAYSDKVEEFKKEECEVIAVSTDSEFAHMAWINTPR